MKATIIIASAFRANLSAVANASRSVNAQKALAAIGLEAQQAVGFYKEDGEAEGSQELSFVFPVHGDDATVEQRIKEVMDLFLGHFEQDCILLVAPQTQEAFLVFADGSQLELGTFQEISEEEAKDALAWTHWQDKYFTCK